ncbi:MAG TPA: permease prefix domain 1-containing protein, partial [Gemmatimonadales bacterium]|nr:permease prefix domain 1-containing protein [Gemmatimonadales bacterium]
MRNLAREVWLRIRGSLRGDDVTGEMDEEFRFHLDQATRRNLARGLSPEAAPREALRAFGRVEGHRLEGGDELR